MIDAFLKYFCIKAFCYSQYSTKWENHKVHKIPELFWPFNTQLALLRCCMHNTFELQRISRFGQEVISLQNVIESIVFFLTLLSAEIINGDTHEIAMKFISAKFYVKKIRTKTAEIPKKPWVCFIYFIPARLFFLRKKT